MASDDDVFWTYGDKRKKNRKAKNVANNDDLVEDNDQNDKKLNSGRSDNQQKIQKEIPQEKPQTDIFSKSTRLNPFGGGQVDFSQSQRFEKLEERFQNNGQGVRFNQSNILGNSQSKNMQNSNGGNGVQFQNQKGNGDMAHSQHQQYDREDKQKYQENFNFSFSPPQKGSQQRNKFNKSGGGFGMSQTTTSNFIFESGSPARSTFNNRKPFNTSEKKINQFSPNVYDKVSATEYKFQRKGESIWDDLYNNAKAMLQKKMILHHEKLNEEDKECVFKPRLVSNNNKYFAYENNKFLERNEQWKEHRDNKLISQRQSKISVDLKECTFQPTLNSHRIRTEIPKEQELDFVQDNQISLLGRAKDTDRNFFYNKHRKEEDLIQREDQIYSPTSQYNNRSYMNAYRMRTEFSQEREQELGQDRNGKSKDPSRPLSYSKNLYKAGNTSSSSANGYANQGTSNLDIKQTGGIVKSYYIRERERFEKCKKMLNQALKKIPDENIL